jgi:amphi-Trp domain-containing protein
MAAARSIPTSGLFFETETRIMNKRKRDIEKDYPQDQFVEKLRRLADAIEQGERFEIQIAGERVYVPARASFNLEHERGDGEEEIEFQIKWEAK